MSEVVHDTAHGVGNAFTRKLGPLPTWAWALVIAGAVYGWYAWKKVSGASSVALGASTPATAGTVLDPLGSGAVSNGSGYSGSVTTYPQGTPAATTNAQWARNVADQLIALGDNPSLVSTTLADYVGGQALPNGGSSIIDQALTKFGSPPEGVLPYDSGTVNLPNQQAPQPGYGAGTRYTVQQGDTFTSILQRFYGKEANPVTARLEASQNGLPWTGGNGLNFAVTPGQVLTLTPNGIAGYQGNTLTTYDPGHGLTPQDLHGFPAPSTAA